MENLSSDGINAADSNTEPEITEVVVSSVSATLNVPTSSKTFRQSQLNLQPGIGGRILSTETVDVSPVQKKWVEEISEFFETVPGKPNEKGMIQMKCLPCVGLGKVKILSGKSTWEFKRHLQNQHQDDFKKLIDSSNTRKLGRSQPEDDFQNSLDAMLLPTNAVIPYGRNHQKQKLFDDLLQNFIVLDGHAFATVKGQGFLNMIHGLDPRLNVPHPTTVSRRLTSSYVEITNKRKGFLATQPPGTLHFIVDIWTSRQMEATIGIKVQFIEENWKLRQFVLGFKHFPEAHTGDNIKRRMRQFLEIEYELRPEQIGTCTVDNASNFRASLRVTDEPLEENLSQGHDAIDDDGAEEDAEEEDPMDDFVNNEEINEEVYTGLSAWDHAELYRNGCLAHLLQLAVKDAIKAHASTETTVKKIRKIVSFFSKSAMWKAALKKETGGFTLIKPIDVRWNSVYKCLTRMLLKTEKVNMVNAVNKVITAAHEHKKETRARTKIPQRISDDEVINIKNICALLEPLAELTDDLQGDGLTSSMAIIGYITAIRGIESVQLEEQLDSEDEVTNFKDELIKSLRTRFLSDETTNERRGNIVTINIFTHPTMILATGLDPRIRVLPFNAAAVSGTCLEGRIPTEGSVYATLREAFQAHKLQLSKSNTSEAKAPDKSKSGCSPPPSKKQKVFELLSGVAAAKEKDVSDGPTFFQEFETYMGLQFADAEVQHLNPLEFWKVNSIKYPTLSVMARRYLAMPASSGSVERLFSVAGSIKTYKRANLSIENLEKLLCIRDGQIVKLQSK